MTPPADIAGIDTTALLIFLGIGLVAGWLAGLILGGGGLLRNLVVGVIGAFVGGWLLSVANITLPVGNTLLAQVLQATIGAVVVIVLARVIVK
ncbi:MAG: GlsB/YeaQ/YmgE family stress response membrane protein [Hyphomicrobiales bacterium]|nr:MAG: GlsB/YeaQ/YmgE family stress response membrane protein [Hyphomicrobiales bacterium]